MKIQFLNGGLANQIFQYIFVRFCELSHPEEGPWFFDDSFFYVTQIHHGYELERVFGLQLRLLSGIFDPDVWDYMIERKRKDNKSIPQQLLESDENLQMVAETDNFAQFNPFSGIIHRVPPTEFSPQIAAFPGDYYYHGYWINKNWLWSFRDTILKELHFPALKTEQNLSYLNDIENTESVAVHIRCGDYLNTFFDVGKAYYLEMIGEMKKAVPNATLFVFTDDPEWCRDNSIALGLNLVEKLIYVEGNTNEDAWQDIVLMSHCKHMILSKSAFAYFAALLNTDLQLAANPTTREL